MEDNSLGFIEPCENCIIKVICGESCDRLLKFFTLTTFESFNREYSREQENEFISYKGFSIKFYK